MITSSLERSTIKRVAIYVRVSTEGQAEHGFSIDAQLRTLRDYCRVYEKDIVHEYVERGISGKNMTDRPELQKMLRDAKLGLFDELLVMKISRLARNTIDLLQMVKYLKEHNVTFSSFSEKFDTDTPMGKFALSMLGAVGELERDTILSGSRMGSQQRVRSGGHIAKAPFGYKVTVLGFNGRKRVTRIDVIPEEATIVTRIFEEYSSGRGLRAIANSLNRHGHVTKLGNPFSICAVRDIIENPFYAGKIRYGRYLNWSERRRKGKNATPTISQGNHPAIITEELWEKVQFLRDKKAHTSTKRFHGDCLLTGLLRCPQCGAAMTANPTINKSKNGPTKRMYYVCGNSRNKGGSVCKSNGIRQTEAEKAVLNRIKEVISKPHILHPIVRAINERKINRVKPLQDELQTIQARLNEIQNTKLKYLKLFELDQIENALLSDRIGELENELNTLHARRSELELDLDGGQAEEVSYETVRSLIERFDRLLESSSFDQRKTLLHLIINKITVSMDKKIHKIEMVFDERTEHHFLNAAPSAAQAVEGAFHTGEGVQYSKHKLSVVI